MLATGKSKVKQMIMGAGKTRLGIFLRINLKLFGMLTLIRLIVSVVAPLLALAVADGKSLVLSVVPKALVEMSRTVLDMPCPQIYSLRLYAYHL